MKKLFSLVLLLTTFICIAVSSQARTLTGKAVKIADGDTFTLLMEGNRTARIRLHGIDAPEIRGGQPFSRAAKNCLSDMIAGQTVTVDVRDTDRYGRYIGVVSTPSVPDVNLQMLIAGMAWHYRHYDNTPAYVKAEHDARASRTGLWRDKKPINPYDWRKKK